MKLLKIDSVKIEYIHLSFDAEVFVIDLVNYLAKLYREKSDDNSVKPESIIDNTKRNCGKNQIERDYRVVDDSGRASIFSVIGITYIPIKNYKVKIFLDTVERKVLVSALEKICFEN